MSSFGFLFTRRWVLFFLAIVVVACGTWWLGQWQFGRLADRKENNAIVRANEQHAAVPLADVLAEGRPASKQNEWLLVTATGTYAPEKTMIWRYRTSAQDVAGVDVVVPLITADGTAVMVDRGFLPTNGNDAELSVPAPPSGSVTVEGYVRLDGTGRSTSVDAALNTRALSSVTAGEATGLPTYGGWVQLKSEDPAPAEAPQTYPLPELGNGPHFFYGIQWWFFGLLAIVGFGYLVWDEYAMTGRKRPEVIGINEDGDPILPPVTPKKQRSNAKAEKKKALKAAYEAAYAREEAERAERK